MDIIENWFTITNRGGMRTFHHEGVDFIIYKGFKLSKYEKHYAVEDVRRSDFYDEVRPSDHKKLVELGFVRGVDQVVNTRNLKRIGIYTRILEKLYTDKLSYKDSLREVSTKEFYEKKLRNCQENIHKNIDLLFLYKTRINQYNLKYSINKEQI